jgi:hypothetical protein
MGVLEYLLTDHLAISEMARVLKPGGTVIITVPSEISAYQAVGRWLGLLSRIKRTLLRQKLEDSTHYSRTCCVPWRLEARLLRAGIKKKESAYCNVVLWPGTRFLPEFPPLLTRRMETLCKFKPLGWLGTQYIIKGERL